MGLKERMCGDVEECYYTAAWGLLRCNWDFAKLQENVSPDFLQKTIEAVKIIRTNSPEFRSVLIKGLDD